MISPPVISSVSSTAKARFRLWPTLLLAMLSQTLVVCLTYSKLLFHPGQYLIIDHYDGIKSYFSVAAFLRQPLGDGGLLRGHNYPFGEYIYYTDSTPLLEVPLHWLVQTVPALQPYGLYIYDVFMLLGLPISTYLLVLLLRRLGVVGWLTILLSVSLPWLGPQTLRLNVGHMSLAYTPAVLFTLWAMHRLYTAWYANQSLVKPFAILLAGIIGAAWLHFYYLPLLGGLLGFFVLGLLIESYKADRSWLQLIVGTGVVLGIAVLSTWGALQILDSFYKERPVGSGGYDWIEWKFQFGSLFRGYIYNKVRFVLERTAEVPYESASYLTGFVLFGLLITAVLLLIRRLPTQARLPRLVAGDSGHFLLLLLLASLPLFFIALGETIELDNGAYVVRNYLNVFMWLHKVTERVTQFRALGRFIWPFWWAVVLGFGWYVGSWQKAPALRWVLPCLSILLVVDTLNATHHYRTVTQRTNLLSWPESTEPVRQLLNWQNFSRYQALLPIPYYHAGSEGQGNIELTIDPDEWLCNTTYQLSMVSGLPLMSHRATRAIHSQAQLLYSVFNSEGPDPKLLARLDQRPILVFLDTAYYDGHNNHFRDLLRDRPEMLATFERGPAFIREQHMRRLNQVGSWSIYEWYPKGKPTAQKAVN